MLSDGTFEDPVLEAEFLLSGLMGYSPTNLFLAKRNEADELTIRRYRLLIEGRKTHVPAAYLLGWKNFMGFEFEVNPFVLIPRPETELLVEWAVHLGRRSLAHPFRVLEIGTGSGCIAVSMAKLMPSARVLATDISPEALQTARRNAAKLFLDRHVRFMSSDLYAELLPEDRGVFDMIISNPPYVTRSEYDLLETDVKNHEPRRALLAGDDGMDVLFPLISGSLDFLKPEGLLLMEIGYRQKEIVCACLRATGFSDIEVRQDYAGHDRMVAARKGI